MIAPPPQPPKKHNGCLVSVLIGLLICTGFLFANQYLLPSASSQAAAQPPQQQAPSTQIPQQAAPVCQGTPTPLPVQCAPTVSPQFINQILCLAKSPTCGDGQALYDLGVQYHIDPAFALAIFQHESDFGTTGVARVTESLPNCRPLDKEHYPGLLDRIVDGYQKFKSWIDGFKAFYLLINYLYIGDGLTTVEAIIYKWAPWADHNNPPQYIAAVRHAIAIWRAGQVALF